MPAQERPESLEGRWDILYRDYPEVYEEGIVTSHEIIVPFGVVCKDTCLTRTECDLYPGSPRRCD